MGPALDLLQLIASLHAFPQTALVSIHNSFQFSILHRSDYSAALSESDAYLKLKPDGALNEQVRGIKESLKRRLASSIAIVEAERPTP